MGDKEYDFTDDAPSYERAEPRASYRAKSSNEFKRRQRAPKGKSIPGGIRQRRNKHWHW